MKRSTNNAFTGATNSIDWKPKQAASTKLSTAPRKSGIYLPNSDQQKAYSSAGNPK
jgi:hypothetical protein